MLDPLKNREDRLTGLHANTQIPKIIGLERIAALTETRRNTPPRFFWETVTKNRSVAFGGNSVSEHFNRPDDFADDRAPRGARDLQYLQHAPPHQEALRGGTQGRYADYYERALYNHILSSIHREEPGYVYFTPIRPEHYRVYSSLKRASGAASARAWRIPAATASSSMPRPGTGST